MSWLQYKHVSAYIEIYSQKRGYCKAVVQEPTASTTTPEQEAQITVHSPPGLQKPTNTNSITEEAVNQYIKENPDVVSKYLRNGRLMETQKQMNARCLKSNYLESR